jgi:hypothetical protein
MLTLSTQERPVQQLHLLIHNGNFSNISWITSLMLDWSAPVYVICFVSLSIKYVPTNSTELIALIVFLAKLKYTNSPEVSS